MFPYFEHLIGVFVIGVLYSTKIVSGRFCEGGHICSLPRECCTQGCCPPYQSGPRQLPPASDHVLNLFFISHWYFWCVVVAIILAILCAYSLWKKRRTLCGWGLADHHTQSEGDSAGSCYAPPQYSRCNSFHHPPPPYTEVTSKPDLYPLVFTCNSDNGKNGSSYLMVQYFRNYIVRPAGSLSATSTVDSLSSSFICNANEANTLVPPPYSRATSPEIGGFSSHSQQHYMIPRSASQLVCANGNHDGLGDNLALQQVYQTHISQYGNTGSVNISAGNQGARDAMAYYNSSQPRMVESGVDSTGSCNNGQLSQDRAGNNSSGQLGSQRTNGFVQSQSDQHFRYIANSNSTISDIFVNNSCTANLDAAGNAERLGHNEQDVQENSHSSKLSMGVGTPAIYSNGCIQTNPHVHKVLSSPKQLVQESSNAVYNSNSSIGGISITVPVATDVSDTYRDLNVLRRSLDTCDEYRDFDRDLDVLRRSLETCDEYRDLDVLRRSLETCCQFLQQQQIPTAASFASGDSPLRMHDFAKKYGDESMRSYMTSGTCSAVSSLANIGTPSSPPQATSPTGEIKEMLDQIRQLQTGAANIEEALLHPRPHLLHTMSSPSPTHQSTQLHADCVHQLQHFPTKPEKHRAVTVTSNTLIRSTHNSPVPKTAVSSASIAPNAQQPTSSFVGSKRPSTLNQNKKKFFIPKPNKALYIPMMANPSQPSLVRSQPKSPISSVVGVNFFSNRGRVRKGWISRSAPTTPGTGLPPNSLGDHSPLLNEHDEDQETEQNLE